jgi:AcrR family transcriptional regulator
VAASNKSRRRHLGENAEDAEELLKKAAQTCVERHGIQKTTMDDIAREAGVSRPTLYRYFQDRDELLMSVLSDRSRELVGRFHRFIAQQPSFREALIEGLLYIADHGRRDPFTRHLILDAPSQARSLSPVRGAESAREFWEPVLDAAEARDQLLPTVERDQCYDWLADVGLTLMVHLEYRNQSADDLRKKIGAFVVPAFMKADDHLGSMPWHSVAEPVAQRDRLV